ncbi:MAG: hypothetical protein J0H67_03015, partial [Rhodospirillales bacterium]|nr:hypothetical protein [Rhodospirillales bacterium]
MTEALERFEAGGLDRMRACAFLFDGSAAGVSELPLSFFTERLLGALAEADPQGETSTQVRVGRPLLASFAQRTTGVRKTSHGGGWTTSHDISAYKYAVWDWLDSLSDDWNSIQREPAQDIFRLHTAECIALSELADVFRDRIDLSLRNTPGYVGAFVLDNGNPVHAHGFFGSLIYAAAIVGGAVVQERSVDGDEDWPLKGAPHFRPGGLIWKDYGWLTDYGPPGIHDRSLSA